MGNNEAWCRLEPETGTWDKHKHDYVLHPGLMDSILQTLLVTSNRNIPLMFDTNRIFIPFHVERMARYPARFTHTLWCHSKGEYSDGMLTGDISVYNDSQEICLEIKGLTVKQTDKENLLKYADRAAPYERLLYSMVWEEKSPGKSKEIPPGTYLIFSDSSQLGEYLEQLLAARGVPCVIARKGDEYRQRGNTFTIHPKTDWERFLKEASWECLSQLQVFYLWGLDAVVSEGGQPRDVETQQEETCGSLLQIATRVARYFKQATLWIITRHAQMVGEQSRLSLFQSPLWGMGKVIALEYPKTWGGLIDIDDTPEAQAAQTIIEEIALESGEDQVAYRRGKRYVPRLVNKSLPPARKNARMKPLVDPGGTYLVTGGTGGLGLVIAEWLKEKGARHIVLNSRSDPSPEVKAFLEKLNQERNRDQKNEKANVVVIKGHVSEAARVEELLNRINRTMPPLRGIIHAAGTLADGMMNEQKWENFARVFKPKINGAWNLHFYTRGIPLDFFILFSSAASLLGNPGQSNYTAANLFLDALASYRKILGLPALSINWGPWGKVGMVASGDSIKAFLHKQGFTELKHREAVTLMENLIQDSNPDAQTGIIDCNWDKYLDYISQFKGVGLHYLEKLAHPGEQASGQSRVLEEIKAAPPEQKKALLTHLVRESAASVLGGEGSQSLNLQVSLLEQGFDSLMAVEFRNVLVKKLGVSLPATLLFNYPAIAEVVTHIEEIMGLDAPVTEPPPAKKTGVDDQFAHLDNLSSGELEELIKNELDSGI
jgi:NADP-dependent 3-hydroxy acid dehydrogenase YdfG/acyl carrier protein